MNEAMAVDKEREIATRNEFAPPQAISNVGGNLAVDSSRSVAEVLAAVQAAKRFPRDSYTALNNILKECERYGLAEKAIYTYPRGGQKVSGPSIRLAEVIARQWGNIDCGIRELEQREGESIMQAYAWDVETNYRQTKNFTVRHERHTKKGVQRLDDPRDIYEMTANNGARRLRACILSIIPGDVVEKAEGMCRRTVARGEKGKTREDRIRDMLFMFDKFGIKKEHIEARVGCPFESITDDHIVDLVGVYNSIKDNVSKRGDYFDLGEARTDAAQEMTEKLKAELGKNDGLSVDKKQ